MAKKKNILNGHKMPNVLDFHVQQIIFFSRRYELKIHLHSGSTQYCSYFQASGTLLIKLLILNMLHAVIKNMNGLSHFTLCGMLTYIYHHNKILMWPFMCWWTVCTYIHSTTEGTTGEWKDSNIMHLLKKCSRNTSENYSLTLELCKLLEKLHL